MTRKNKKQRGKERVDEYKKEEDILGWKIAQEHFAINKMSHL